MQKEPATNPQTVTECDICPKRDKCPVANLAIELIMQSCFHWKDLN